MADLHVPLPSVAHEEHVRERFLLDHLDQACAHPFPDARVVVAALDAILVK